jgi:hypothetical protein
MNYGNNCGDPKLEVPWYFWKQMEATKTIYPNEVGPVFHEIRKHIEERGKSQWCADARKLVLIYVAASKKD